MKFLCLCYYDTAAFARMSPEDAAKIEPACKPHDARLKATGKVPVIGSLAFPEKWSSFVPREELGFAVEVRPCELYEELS
jgi:hypothetical protein